MMDHDPSRSSSSIGDKPQNKPAAKPPATTGAGRLREVFARERFVAFADRVGLTRLARVPGIGWVVGIAALALFIQGVGLANLVAVNEDKQKWEAASGQRDYLLKEISELEARQLKAKNELHTIKGMIDHESGRLAEVQAALKLTHQLRDDAQREHGAARNEADRLRESNETLAAQARELAAKHATTTTLIAGLEADRERLAAEVVVSKKSLEEHRAEVARAQQHVKDLDGQAAATLESIRQSRESQVKAQAQLDEANRLAAKAAAEVEAGKVRLAAIEADITASSSALESLRQQQASLKAQLATDKKLAAEAGESRAALESELTALGEKLDKATKTLAQRQGAAAAEESLITAAQVRHEALKTRIANLQAELKPLEEQRLALEADIAGKRKELEALRQRIDAARNDLAAPPPVGKTPADSKPDPQPDAKDPNPAAPAPGKTPPSDLPPSPGAPEAPDSPNHPDDPQ